MNLSIPAFIGLFAAMFVAALRRQEPEERTAISNGALLQVALVVGICACYGWFWHVLKGLNFMLFSQ